MAAAIRVPVASPGDHVAHFYHDDEELAGQVGSYLLDAFRDDGVAIAIATPEHLRALETWLAGAGVDMAAAAPAAPGWPWTQPPRCAGSPPAARPMRPGSTARSAA